MEQIKTTNGNMAYQVPVKGPMVFLNRNGRNIPPIFVNRKTGYKMIPQNKGDWIMGLEGNIVVVSYYDGISLKEIYRSPYEEIANLLPGFLRPGLRLLKKSEE